MPIIYDQPGQFGGDHTLDDLVDEVLMHLQGYTTKGDQVTYLSEDITADATTIKVNDVDQVSRGIVEVGDELIRVQSVDRTAGTFTALPSGRGWRGTIPAAHESLTTITMSPLVPRVAIARAINDTLQSLYPTLYAVNDTTLTIGTALAYEIPDDADLVLSVRYRDTNGDWQRCRRWEVEHSASGFDSGRSVRILDVPLGYTVQVVYGSAPTLMTTFSSTFTDTGLPPHWRDMVVLGAQARLVPSLDTARLSVRTVSADELDQPIQLGSAIQIAKDMTARFTARVEQERSILQRNYPTPIHFVR